MPWLTDGAINSYQSFWVLPDVLSDNCRNWLWVNFWARGLWRSNEFSKSKASVYRDAWRPSLCPGIAKAICTCKHPFQYCWVLHETTLWLPLSELRVKILFESSKKKLPRTPCVWHRQKTCLKHPVHTTASKQSKQAVRVFEKGRLWSEQFISMENIQGQFF